MGLLASVPELSARTRQAFVVGVWFSHFFAGSAPSRCLFLEPSDDLLGPLSWSSAFLASASFILLNRCYFLVQTITRCVVLALLLLFNFQELSFDVVLGSCLFREECPAPVSRGNHTISLTGLMTARHMPWLRGFLSTLTALALSSSGAFIVTMPRGSPLSTSLSCGENGTPGTERLGHLPTSHSSEVGPIRRGWAHVQALS